MNQEEIMKILPHRKPMLLIDDASLDEDGNACAHYTVRGDEFFLDGHFPGNKIVPGVILCEMMAQASCVMFKDDMKYNILPVYAGLDKVRFKGMVRPGDTVCIKTKLVRSSNSLYKLHGEIYVEERLCMMGDFSVALYGERE